MKTQWERYCELRNFDNWCLRNPRKANLVALAAAIVVFALSQILKLAVESIARILGVPEDLILDLILMSLVIAILYVAEKQRGEDE